MVFKEHLADRRKVLFYDSAEVFPRLESLVCIFAACGHVEGGCSYGRIIKSIVTAVIFRRVCAHGCHAGKADAAIERKLSYACHGVCYGGALHAFAASERTFSYFRHGARDGNARKFRAVKERPVSYARHAVADSYTRKAATILERMLSYACHGVWNGDARQAFASRKRVTSYVLYGVGDGNARQFSAFIERTFPDALH